ncbi:MAG: type VI secretion system baseplate subunit TssK [Phycisphaerales bacterium]
MHHPHIHWEEGLFLQQHHLQMMQKSIAGDAAIERRLFASHPYGVIESHLSPDELSNLVIRFERLRVIMPSGVVVDFPGDAELPPRDIKKQFEAGSGPIQVSLAVPLWYDTRGNTVDNTPESDARTKRIYKVSEIERVDENTGENPQPIRVRRANARLILTGEDETDLEVLPLLRVVQGTGDQIGLPRADPNFVPPCCVMEGSATLRKMVRDLANAVDASRRELVVQMTRGGFSVETMRGIQFEQMLRLQTLNRFAGTLPAMADANGIPPFRMYLFLRELLGELAALAPDRDPFAVPDYNHDAPYIPFADLIGRIRDLLRGAVAASFMKVDFSREGPLFVATLSDEHFTRASEYYLAIRSKDDATVLSKLVCNEDEFKLMPRSLAGRAVRGIKLVEERHPPLQLPSDSALHYYRLVLSDSQRAWALIEKEKTTSAEWPGSATADMQLSLYMPVGGGS